MRKLCGIAGVRKLRTTPYHPMGNGMSERYNKTHLNVLGTLFEQQKSDWKSYVSTLTHAYNAAEHESTGYAPFYLMFGRHPRLAIDAFLGWNKIHLLQKVTRTMLTNSERSLTLLTNVHQTRPEELHRNTRSTTIRMSSISSCSQGIEYFLGMLT